MSVKQSVCYPMMKPESIPLDAFVVEVKAMGFAAIELWKPGDDFEEVVELAQAHDLAIATISGHDSLAVGLNDPGQHDRIEAELHASIDLAAEVGIPGLICFSGNRREGVSEEDSMAATVEGLRRVAPYAEKRGVNLNMELLNTKVDHPGYECDHSAWGLEVCRRVNSPNVKLLYDIYHMQIMEGDIIRTITENMQWIGHFHAAGVPGRHDFDDTQELNYRGICRAISASGYEFYVGYEYKPKGDVYDSLRRTFEICDQ